jgi:predicted nucleic-acid-binding protein
MPINEQKIIEKILQLEDRIDRVESSLNEKIDKVQDNILSAIDSYAKKSSDFSDEQVMTRATLDCHEEEIFNIKKKIKIV